MEEKVQEFSITITELKEDGQSFTLTIPCLLKWLAAMAEAEKTAPASSIEVDMKIEKGEQQ